MKNVTTNTQIKGSKVDDVTYHFQLHIVVEDPSCLYA